MKKVGITGGIGSGKTLVCQIFYHLGIPVFNADREARYLMDHDEQLKYQLQEAFGKEIYTGGRINRKQFASLIFSDKNRLASANEIIHPFVGRYFKSWVAGRKNVPYVVEEAAILFESGAHRMMDAIVTVTAPEELRIQRVMKRDGVKRKGVENRMKHQMTEDEKINGADHVINNDENRLLLPQVIDIHEKIKNS
ncbi:MAG: dephospho-CoA kinase [Bacteroidota bacterium]